MYTFSKCQCIMMQEDMLQAMHACIINLVIGTLYCAKANYEFGISRIIKSLDPLSVKLDADTWFYAKRCLLALADGLAKHMIYVDDKAMESVTDFLDAVQTQGQSILASHGGNDAITRTVGTEAANLKSMFWKLDLQ
jgi:tetratricopeptide repeat protein 30